MLKKLGIVKGKETKAAKIFLEITPNFFDIEYSKPSEYVNILWERYQKIKNKNNNLNGVMFEYILATLCIRENILPLYMGAKVAFVPNVIFDIMFYTAERGPICWSVKTSLRERYKQADLESIALKYVHRKALSYLITLDKKEAKSAKTKIKTGDIIGLEDVIVATSEEFNNLVKNLKTFYFEKPPVVKVIQSTNYITIDNVKSVFPDYK